MIWVELGVAVIWTLGLVAWSEFRYREGRREGFLRGQAEQLEAARAWAASLNPAQFRKWALNVVGDPQGERR